MPNMSRDVARRVYEILVRHAGAYPNDASSFLSAQSGPDSPQEWRFKGLLGFGGKFWVYHRDGACPWYINCYKEDADKERTAIIDNVNRQLSVLYQEVSTGQPTVEAVVATNDNVVEAPIPVGPPVSLRASRKRR